MTELVLHYAPDNASLVVRLALEELGLPYQTRLVDRRAKAQSSAAYLRVNPAGRIPALETPDGPVFETAAILMWLADQHGALAPQTHAPERGTFLSWLFFTSNTLHAALRTTFYPETYAPGAEATLRQTQQAALARHVALIEAEAAKGVWWLSPDHPSILSLYVATCLRWVQIYPKGQTDWFDWTPYPALRAMARGLQTRPSALSVSTAEGLGPTIFTAPRYATPPEGSAL